MLNSFQHLVDHDWNLKAKSQKKAQGNAWAFSCVKVYDNQC